MIDMRDSLAWIVLTMALLGCGAAPPPPSTSSTPRTEPAVQGDPTDGGRRRAEQGARCDFGGSAELTCQRGLDCCYGPPSDPGAFGECMSECPAY